VRIGADRSGTRADTVTFVVCLSLALILLALPAAIRMPLASALRRTVLLPVVALESRAAAAHEERQNLAAIRAERDSLALAAALLPDVEAENARLRALLGLRDRLRFGYVPAEVLHQSDLTDGLTLLLSAGRSDGVRRLSAVVAPEGLVGMVISVDPHSAVAMAWTHPDFRASAMVEGRNVSGIVAARSVAGARDAMALEGVPFRDELPMGTTIVTSGLGGVFPRGIPLGTVSGILGASEGWERTYLLRPAASPARVSHVLVLSPDRATDTLTAAFDTTAAPGTPRASRRAVPAPAGTAGAR
jgi:rod shape-determining protein MreC